MINPVYTFAISLNNIQTIDEGKNLLNRDADDVETGRVLNPNSGSLNSNASYNTSGYINIQSIIPTYLNKVIALDFWASMGYIYCCYDSSKKFIKGGGFDGSKPLYVPQVPSNTKYVRASINTKDWPTTPRRCWFDVFVLVEGLWPNEMSIMYTRPSGSLFSLKKNLDGDIVFKGNYFKYFSNLPISKSLTFAVLSGDGSSDDLYVLFKGIISIHHIEFNADDESCSISTQTDDLEEILSDKGEEEINIIDLGLTSYKCHIQRPSIVQFYLTNTMEGNASSTLQYPIGDRDSDRNLAIGGFPFFVTNYIYEYSWDRPCIPTRFSGPYWDDPWEVSKVWWNSFLPIPGLYEIPQTWKQFEVTDLNYDRENDISYPDKYIAFDPTTDDIATAFAVEGEAWYYNGSVMGDFMYAHGGWDTDYRGKKLPDGRFAFVPFDSGLFWTTHRTVSFLLCDLKRVEIIESSPNDPEPFGPETRSEAGNQDAWWRTKQCSHNLELYIENFPGVGKLFFWGYFNGEYYNRFYAYKSSEIFMYIQQSDDEDWGRDILVIGRKLPNGQTSNVYYAEFKQQDRAFEREYKFYIYHQTALDRLKKRRPQQTSAADERAFPPAFVGMLRDSVPFCRVITNNYFGEDINLKDPWEADDMAVMSQYFPSYTKKMEMPGSFMNSFMVKSDRFTNTPNDIGRGIHDMYFLPPDDEEGKWVPIFSKSWFCYSFWCLAKSKAYTDLEEYAPSPDFVGKNCYKGLDVMVALAQKAIPGIIGIESTFFTSITNPVTKEKNATFLLEAKSDFMHGQTYNPATICKLTLKTILDFVKNVFNVYWHITDNHYLRFEHISWYLNGGQYDTKANPAADLTSIIEPKTKEPYAYGTTKYKYLSEELSSGVTLKYSVGTRDAYQAVKVEYVDDSCKDNKITEINSGRFSPDLDSLFADSSQEQEGVVPMMGLAREDGDFNIEVSGGFSNAQFTTAEIFRKYYKHNSPSKKIVIDKITYDALSMQRIIVQENLQYPSEINLGKFALIKTYIGVGNIHSITLNLSNRTLNISLRHEPKR